MIAIGLACNPKLHHRRRAHHRARRHHPGADPRADEGSVAPAQHRAHHHYPQPRRRCALCRPRDRHVCRAHRRAGPGRRGVPPPAASLYLGLAALSTATRPCRAAASWKPSRACRRICATAPTGCRFAPRCPYRIDGVRPGAAAAARPTPAGFRAAIGKQRSRQARSPGRPPPALLRPPRAKSTTPVLSVRNLTKYFSVSGGLRGTAGTVRAVEDVSFDIIPARRSGWSANPAAARPRSAG